MTTGDWDFNNANWDLDGVLFVSPPSSLRIVGPNAFRESRGLIKTTVVPIAYVKEGRVATQYRYEDITADRNRLWIIFRYQDDNNYYYVRFAAEGIPADELNIRVYCVKAGVTTALGAAVATNYHAFNTWRNYRVTWWNDFVGLVIRVEVWNGSAWEVIRDQYHTDNEWKDVGGRVGVSIQGWQVGLDTNVDDTFIYGIPT